MSLQSDPVLETQKGSYTYKVRQSPDYPSRWSVDLRAVETGKLYGTVYYGTEFAADQIQELIRAINEDANIEPQPSCVAA